MFKIACDAFATPANSDDSFATVLLIFDEFANFSRKLYASGICLREIPALDLAIKESTIIQ